MSYPLNLFDIMKLYSMTASEVKELVFLALGYIYNNIDKDMKITETTLDALFLKIEDNINLYDMENIQPIHVAGKSALSVCNKGTIHGAYSVEYLAAFVLYKEGLVKKEEFAEKKYNNDSVKKGYWGMKYKECVSSQKAHIFSDEQKTTTYDEEILYKKNSQYALEPKKLRDSLNHIKRQQQDIDKKQYYYNANPNFRLEMEIKDLEYDRKNNVNNILFLIDTYTDFIDEEFISLLNIHFQYDWYNNAALRYCKTIYQIIDLVLEKYQSYTNDYLSLQNNFLRVNWSLGETEIAKKLYNLQDKQMRYIEQAQKLSLPKIHNLYRNLYDYGCGFYTEVTDKYVDLGENWLGDSISKNALKVITRQCSACRYIRTGDLDKAQMWLEEANELRCKHRKDINLPFRFKIDENYENLGIDNDAYYKMIRGTYHFMKKDYEKGEIILLQSLEIFKVILEKDEVLVMGFISYMLYKIYKEYGNKNFEFYYFSEAKRIINSSLKKNYCLFDYHEIYKELNNTILIF